MGTWSQPHTKEKAQQLKALLEMPLRAEGATDTLYDLCGDDDLFDFIDTLPPEAEINLLIKSHIFKTLAQRNYSTLKWDMEALKICQSIVEPERQR